MRDPFELAVQHHQAGQLEHAEILYKQVLARQPAHADAVHNLGVIALQSRRNDLAVILLRRAVTLAPLQARGYSNLGNALIGLGQVDEAIATYRHALALEPGHRDAMGNLGVALLDKGAYDESVSIYRSLIAKDSGNVEAYYNLGLAQLAKKQVPQAIECFRRAIALRPGYAAAHHNLATLLSGNDEFKEAIAEFQKAIAADPRFVQAYFYLGNTLMRAEEPTQAMLVYRRLIELDQNHVEGYHRLGEALMHLGELDAAIGCFRESIAINPAHTDGHVSLAHALKDAGLLEEAVVHIRQAMVLRPESAHIHSDLILALQYCSGLDPVQVSSEIGNWNLRHALPVQRVILNTVVDRAPGRRLRVGYVSPDFTHHPVGRFAIPIIAGHHRRGFEIHCFSNTARADVVTHWFEGHTDQWHDISRMDDAQAADLIASKQIDILVDLSLHTGNHRLMVFARKPAAIQATHLGYCGTSGMESMDYVIADRYLCPPGMDAAFLEKIQRLPGCYWCYRPVPQSPDSGSLPAHANGFVTFGCLNNFCKVSDAALKVWTTLLQAVPGSRLLLYSKQGSHRQRLSDSLSKAGVDPVRLDFVAHVPISSYLQQYHSIDICLDPFPFCGGTTTCDALWMGVPVVSLAGQTPVSRGGLSILSNVGLPELVATSADEYVRIATELAGDLPRLAQLRATLRQRMQNSPLMHEEQYVRDLEAIYREMWVRWCAS